MTPTQHRGSGPVEPVAAVNDEGPRLAVPVGVTIAISEFGVTFAPDVTDLLQILIDLNAVLDAGNPRLDYLADDVAWLAHSRTRTSSGQTWRATERGTPDELRMRAVGEFVTVPCHG